jgi:hypothetical protein
VRQNGSAWENVKAKERLDKKAKEVRTEKEIFINCSHSCPGKHFPTWLACEILKYL